MKDGKLLSKKSLKNLRYNKVRVLDLEEKVHIKIQEPENDFSLMMMFRKPANLQQMSRELHKKGHLFANLGVSGLVTASLGDENYLILVRQIRKDFDDVVLKLVSGYVEEENIRKLKNAVEKEISEEILLIDGFGRLARFVKDGYCFNNPYTKILEDSFNFVNLRKGAGFNFGVDFKKIYIDEKFAGDAEVLYHPDKNSVQVVYGYNFDLENASSVYHAEDKNEGDFLKAFLDKKGIYLAGLNNGNLDSRLYRLINGKLIEKNINGILLSEAFTSDKGGFCLGNNIRFEEYCRRIS